MKGLLLRICIDKGVGSCLGPISTRFQAPAGLSSAAIVIFFIGIAVIIRGIILVKKR